MLPVSIEVCLLKFEDYQSCKKINRILTFTAVLACFLTTTSDVKRGAHISKTNRITDLTVSSPANTI